MQGKKYVSLPLIHLIFHKILLSYKNYMHICRILLYIRIYAEYNISMIEIKRNRIKQYLRRKKYSRKKFAGMVGITVRELNKILDGEFDFKFISLILLGNYFSCDIDLLIDFKRKPVQTEYYL